MLRRFNWRALMHLLLCPCWCCNLSAGVTLHVRFTANGMCAKNNIHINVVRTSNNRVTSSGDLCCCLLPQCEALRTCRTSFPIASLVDIRTVVCSGPSCSGRNKIEAPVGCNVSVPVRATKPSQRTLAAGSNVKQGGIWGQPRASSLEARTVWALWTGL